MACSRDTSSCCTSPDAAGSAATSSAAPWSVPASASTDAGPGPASKRQRSCPSSSSLPSVAQRSTRSQTRATKGRVRESAPRAAASASTVGISLARKSGWCSMMCSTTKWPNWSPTRAGASVVLCNSCPRRCLGNRSSTRCKIRHPYLCLATATATGSISGTTNSMADGSTSSTIFCTTWLACRFVDMLATWPANSRTRSLHCEGVMMDSAFCTTRQPMGWKANSTARAITCFSSFCC
mmetsp:Transcript_54713/g.119969  ORF Transcript_54713/g.119969 Transcript_54713/m.119969 type:complete len:238 (-) Transcript_54713:404-1117(-)